MINLGQIKYQLGVDTAGLNKASRHVNSFQNNTTKGFNAVNKAANTLRNSIALLISTETLRRTALFTESFGLLEDRLKAVVGSSNEANRAFSKLRKISAQTGASLDVTAGGFQKLLFAKETVNATTKEMMTLTESFVKLGMISGTNTQTLNSAMLQFSQGLISGTFQAQEFQSVLEGVPAIAGEIAAGMGITVEQLIKLKKEGKLASEDVFNALLKRTQEINNTAEQIPMRLSRGFSRFMLGIQETLGEIDKANSLTTSLGQSFFDAGEKLKNVPIYLEASFKTMKEIAQQNEGLFNIAKTFIGLQVSILAVNTALGTTSALMSLLNKQNAFLAITAGVIAFRNEILAASFASQKLFTSLSHMMNLDFSEAANALKSIPDAYQESLNKLNSKSENDEGGLINNLLGNLDLSKLDMVKSFQDQMLALQVESQQKMIQSQNDLQDQHIKDYQKHLKHKFSITKQFHKMMQSFNDAKNSQVTEDDKTMMRNQLSNAAAHSKAMFDLNKALALVDLMVAAPAAVGKAIAWGAKFGPIVATGAGAAMSAAMGAQIGAVAGTNFPGRAIGGDVFPNSIYKTNENGPEMFSFGGNDFLSTGNSRGSITPNHKLGDSGSASASNVIVNIHNVEGQTATVEQNSDGSILDVFIEKADEAFADGITSGESLLSKAMTSQFGLNRALGGL